MDRSHLTAIILLGLTALVPAGCVTRPEAEAPPPARRELSPARREISRPKPSAAPKVRPALPAPRAARKKPPAKRTAWTAPP
ncbi:MAG: hypothetical protein V3V62_06370, partial [bacterium]